MVLLNALIDMERGHEGDHHEQSKQRPWTTSFDLVSLLNENWGLYKTVK